MNTISKLSPVVGLAMGVIFYEIGNTFLYLINPIFFPTFFRLIGFVTIVYFLSQSSRLRFSGGISSALSVLMCWTIIMMVRGFLDVVLNSGNSIYEAFRVLFLSPFGGFAYFIPFFAIREFSMNDFHSLKKLAIFFCAFAIISSFFFRESISSGLLTTGYSSTVGGSDEELSVRALIRALFPGYGIIILFLFCFNYIKGFSSFLFPIAVLTFFFSAAIGGGRGDTTFSLIYLLAFFYLLTKYRINTGQGDTFVKKKQFSRVIYFALGLAFIYLLWFLYSNTTVFDFVLERAFGSKMLGTEITDFNRDILKEAMIKDFNDHPLDWIWGRGVNGAYSTMILDEGGYRQWMEWGYLYLILKGGVVYLTLYVYIMIHAAYVGFFRSRNGLSKGLAVMCIMYLINLISTESEPQFSSQFFFSWFCVGLLEQSKVREASDDTIYGCFNDKYYQCL